uniref:Uncharacterized protein n=1 Tax=Fagus sylvatica TaxID=28930 RepID=A0A2N9HCK1_FAGSY
MIGGGEEAPAAAGSSQPLEWKFEQVFGERAAGEEVQEGLTFFRMCKKITYLAGVVAARISTWWRPINGVEVFVRA